MGQISVEGSQIGTTGLCRRRHGFLLLQYLCTLQPVPPSNVWGLVVFLCNSPVFNTLLSRVHCNVLLARNACCKPSCNMLSVKGVIQTVQE